MQPIGVFDSGIGGLTILKELLKELPNENYVYLADTKNCPYGEKTPSEIKSIVISICKYLINYYNTKMILMGCNFSSAVALPVVKKMFNIPIIGLVDIALQEAIRRTKNNKIGLIATRGTIRSNIYQKKFRRLNKGKYQLYAKSCPKFVPLIEEGKLNTPEVYSIARSYLNYLKNKDIDTLIMGCTHFPYLADIIKKIMGKNVKLVNPAVGVVKETKRILKNNNMMGEKKREYVKFLATGYDTSLLTHGANFLGIKIDKVEKVTLT